MRLPLFAPRPDDCSLAVTLVLYAQAVRWLIEDPQRPRSVVLDCYVQETGRYLSPLVPLWYKTGSPYHTSWRAAFATAFTERAEVRAALAGGGSEGVPEKIAAMAAPALASWVASCTHGDDQLRLPA